MKTPHTPSLALVICSLLFITSAGKGQSMNGLTLDGIFAGSLGTPITFPAAEWDCINGDPHASEIYDFGPGASPATTTVQGTWDGVISVHFSPVVVTYSTPGVKTFTLTSITDGHSPITDTFALRIYDCSK